MLRRLALAAAGIAALGLPPAVAQDYTLPPTFGEIALTVGFLPDPVNVDITAGGTIDATAAFTGQTTTGNCVGFIADAPDYRLQYEAGGAPLYISVFAAEDTTLIVNGPDGQWYCDDDGNGYPNPTLLFATPLSGQYDIWVGAYGGGFPSATLRISELNAGP